MRTSSKEMENGTLRVRRCSKQKKYTLIDALSLVEYSRLELLASSMPWKRSTGWANAPSVNEYNKTLLVREVFLLAVARPPGAVLTFAICLFLPAPRLPLAHQLLCIMAGYSPKRKLFGTIKISMMKGRQRRLEKYVKKYFQKHPEVKVVAVTGSIGKTYTKIAIVTILNQRYRVRLFHGNRGTNFTTPMAILGID